VRLIPAQLVETYVKAQKNDYRDAEAISEAVQRPTMRLVPIKTEEKLDLQALRGTSERLLNQGKRLVNQFSAFLLVRGSTVRRGAPHLPLLTTRSTIAKLTRRGTACRGIDGTSKLFLLCNPLV
jgi:transposase